MPRRSILSATERENLLALPDAKDDLIRYYMFGDQHRERSNRQAGSHRAHGPAARD